MTTVLLLLLCNLADAGLRIEATADPTRAVISASLPDALLAGLPEGKVAPELGERRLRLALIDSTNGAEGPAIFGAYERMGNRLAFTPRYPLASGQSYRATLHLGPGLTLTSEYRVPSRPTTPSAVVERIYPTAAELPANQLKFYLYFSKPMREGRDIFDHFQLLDERGKPVADPWRRTELWSADGKRLTLWIHPGRIKEGVNLREELGPVLEPDRQYTLVVGTNFLDGDGQPLGREFTKRFRATKPERTLPRVEDWSVTAPQAGSREPLELKFPRAFDHALLNRLLSVHDEQGRALAGRIEVGAQERSWRFHPEQPWRSVPHTVAVDPRLEDLAGNTPQQRFDVDREEPEPAATRLTVPFAPKQ